MFLGRLKSRLTPPSERGVALDQENRAAAPVTRRVLTDFRKYNAQHVPTIPVPMIVILGLLPRSPRPAG